MGTFSGDGMDWQWGSVSNLRHWMLTVTGLCGPGSEGQHEEGQTPHYDLYYR